ncbi:hypothetical protein [Tenacibaculum sp.]|uniref:hypothetical protein n=1 Tax=Tenacibaculum sp. TaxID=1906242 RepID=UPI003D10E9AF
MTGEEILVKLKQEGFIVETGENNYILSNKLERMQEAMRTPLTTEETVKTPDKSLKQFMADCQIPFRAKGVNGVQYQLNAISDYGTKAFNKILIEGKYEYEDMVAATKKYYHDSSMARVTMTNYFKLNVFENVMEEYLKKKSSIHAGPGKNSTWGGRMSL